jgi:pilus assembly protein CpaD
MSRTAFATRTVAAAERSDRLRKFNSALPVLAVAIAALLAGCANRDSVVVGSIPDDYRTNHPIVISEKDQKLDLPVAASAKGMTETQRQALLGFFDTYDTSAAPVLTIAVPSGSANEIAARTAARDFARLASASGIRSNRIAMASYQASSAEVSAPVRLVYTSIRAHTDKCGRWPEDLLETTENKHYANFGCSYQNNLAAQIANPTDLLGPRKRTTIDAENRSEVIDVYRRRGIPDEFFGSSEVNY